MVGDGDAEALGPAVRPDDDRRTIRRELDRVVDEIADGATHPAHIRRDRDRLHTTFKLESLLARLREHAVILDDLAHQGAGVDLDALEQDRAVFDARHLEEVLGEFLEPVHVAIGALRELVLGSRERSGTLAEEDLERAADDCERAAEVMGHRRKELRLHAIKRAEGLGLRALMFERLALVAQRPELAEQAGHKEPREQIDRDREHETVRLRDEAEARRTVESDAHVGRSHEYRRRDRTAARETKPTRYHEEHADEIRAPVRIGCEHQDRVGDHDEVHAEHDARAELRVAPVPPGPHEYRDERGVRDEREAKQENVPQTELREERSEQKGERGSAEPRQIERLLEALELHGTTWRGSGH